MPRIVERPAPVSAPATRAESTLARERPSAPIRSSGGIVSPMSEFLSTWSFGRTMPTSPAMTNTHIGVSTPASARTISSAASTA